MKKLLLYISLLFLVLSVNVYSQNPGAPGSYSLFHTQEARTFNPGRLNAYANYNFFTKLGEFIGGAPANFDAANWWLIAGNLAFTYGIIDHLDMSFGLRLYQDTHHDNEFNLPDDIFVSLKTGSYFFGRERFALGLVASTRLGVGEVHNYPFAEYASGAVEFGLKAALSFYADPYFPERSINAHFNIGWWNHNEKGQKIPVIGGEDREATVSSSHLSMALATVVPLGEFEIRGELSGILFLKDPDKFIYSAEDYAYFTPSIRYKPYDWVSMDLGIGNLKFYLWVAKRFTAGKAPIRMSCACSNIMTNSKPKK
jgi:hypothetical protein